MYSFNISPEAIKAIKFILMDNPNSNIRIGVKGSGCDGLSYIIELDNNPLHQKDVVLTYDDFNVFIDQKSFKYLNGTTLNYINEPLNKRFIFDNPNAISSCGCGNSFSVK